MKKTFAIVSFALLALLPSLATANEPIPEGEYECRESKEYKFTPCQVQNINDNYILTTNGSLVSLTAVLNENDGMVMLDATTNDERRFGCHNCNAECAADQANCQCKELPAEASKACQASPIFGSLKKKGSKWKGTIIMRMYSHVYGDVDGTRMPIDVETELQSFEFTIRKAK